MQELDKKMVELYQEMGRGQGITDSLMLDIFGRLLIEPEPIAMEELAKKSGYSLASISNKVKVLAPVMHIKRIKKPGSKKIYLYMEKDILKVWKEAIGKKEKYVINLAKERIPPIIKEYKEKAKTEKEKKKVKAVEQYYDQIIKFEKIIGKIIKVLEKAE
jgi:DNA-binding transcriptional regulator GbsR (MarR family)